MRKIFAALAFLISAVAWGQPGQTYTLVFIAPSGSCTGGATAQLVYSTGAYWTCQSVNTGTGIGTWTVIGGGSGSFVTLSKDAISQSNGGSTTVVGING